MRYSGIDEIVKNWALDNNQRLLSEYKDCEVRSFEVFNKGRKFQIWIDHPAGGFVGVHVWDYKRKRMDWNVTTSNLYPTLDEAFATIFEWNQA